VRIDKPSELILQQFAGINHDILQPYGIMPEGLPRILPPFGEFEHFKVADQWTYISHTGVIVQVVDNTLTDLASVPFPFRELLAIPGRESAGAVAHDSGYSAPLRPRWNLLQDRWELLGKRDWDDIFDRINRMAGTSPIKCGCLQFGLRVGGWFVWRKYCRENPCTLNVPVLPLKPISVSICSEP
jgi:hypothetical protein